MNKSGKSNLIFLILIPIFIILTLIIVDTIVSYGENKRFKNVTENIIKEVLNNDDLTEDEYYNEIKRLYELNNYETNMLVVTSDYNGITINNEHSYFGIFSSLTNKRGEDTRVKIFGIEFNVKKGSKAIINVNASINYEDEIEFNYVEE